jgi:magnesium transporter
MTSNPQPPNKRDGEGDQEPLSAAELRDAWLVLSRSDRVTGFRLLNREQAEDLFLSLDAREHAILLEDLTPPEARSWIRLLPPDDAADCIQQADPARREDLTALLDEATRAEVRALLAYAEDEAGGLMSPRFARLRPDMRVAEAVAYLRRQTHDRAEIVYYVYVLDQEQRLLGVVSFRELLTAESTRLVRDIMLTDFVSIPEDMDQEAVSDVFSETDLLALPVVDPQGRIKGIVTVDDIVDVVKEEATEDIHKIGGVAALGGGYLEVGLVTMLRKRSGWLSILFISEMLTATAMAHFQDEIARAVLLTVFQPLILSAGGNSGSQATTLIIRAMVLGEVRMRDWFHVMRREIAAGLSLGLMLGAMGAIRIIFWHAVFHDYGAHYLLVAMTVGFSVLLVVLWGTLVGSMLPLVLRRIGLDPASASAPFVATLVDVSGLIIYFSIASMILRGTLL